VVVVVSEVADFEVVAEVSVVATAMAVATAMVATAAISAIAGADTFARTIERSVGPIRNQNEKGASIIRRTFLLIAPVRVILTHHYSAGDHWLQGRV
jgi:Na+/proline symporter